MTEKLVAMEVEARERFGFFRGQRYWSVIIARNGEIIYTSETYTTAEKRDQTARQMAAQLEVPYTDEGAAARKKA